jgi:tRNA (pseudouridine54-N1)-methyltransferase
MREFIYYSSTAPTRGNFGEDLVKAGRLDIAVHTVISAFFLSHAVRDDVKLHLVFGGPPDPVKHLELKPVLSGKTGIDKIYFSKNNVSALIKKMLYKFRDGVKSEVFPGYWIEKKDLISVLRDLVDEGKTIYILDREGKDIRSIEISENPVFLIGDHQGKLPKLNSKEMKRMKDFIVPVSIGKKTYFASQTVAIVNNELDRREEIKMIQS